MGWLLAAGVTCGQEPSYPSTQCPTVGACQLLLGGVFRRTDFLGNAVASRTTPLNAWKSVRFLPTCRPLTGLDLSTARVIKQKALECLDCLVMQAWHNVAIGARHLVHNSRVYARF
jgi:hypothetical protein